MCLGDIHIHRVDKRLADGNHNRVYARNFGDQSVLLWARLSDEEPALNDSPVLVPAHQVKEPVMLTLYYTGKLGELQCLAVPPSTAAFSDLEIKKGKAGWQKAISNSSALPATVWLEAWDITAGDVSPASVWVQSPRVLDPFDSWTIDLTHIRGLPRVHNVFVVYNGEVERHAV